MSKIKIELPYPPTVNTYWGHRVIRGKRSFVSTYVTKKGKEYKEAVNIIVKSEGFNVGFKCKLSAKISVYVPDKRQRDLDNILKCLLDSLEECGVYENDSLIDDLHVIRKGQIKGGKVIVEIEKIP